MLTVDEHDLNPGIGQRRTTSTGLAYAKNGSAVTYVFGERWDEGSLS